MSNHTPIEMNMMGLTLYVTTRPSQRYPTGHQYACQAVTWEEAPHGKLRVYAQAWPGYGRYRGWVTLTKRERETFFETMKIKV